MDKIKTAHHSTSVENKVGMLDLIVKPLEEQTAKNILQKHIMMET